MAYKCLQFLGEMLEGMSPGDVFYILNHQIPQVAILIADKGVITNEGLFTPSHRMVRYYGEWMGVFPVDSDECLEGESFYVEHRPYSEFPLGAVFLIIDSDRNIGSLKMVTEIDTEGKCLVLHDGDAIGFDCDDPCVVPTGAVFDLDFFNVTEE